MDIGEINSNFQIEEFLASEGFYPSVEKKGGLELWYNRPIRNESTPSFKVQTEKNVWFDYGLRIGGKLIDLYKKLKNNEDVREAIYFFNNEYKGGIGNYNHTNIVKKRENIKENNSEEIIEKIMPIQNVKLWDYLRERKIDFDIAKEYLTEVHYKSNGKNWYALGFKCDNAGYELRNSLKNSKRNINGKNITTRKNDSDKVKIFEGYFDFLSYASEHKNSYKNYDYIVLNTSAFVDGMYNKKNREEDYLYKNLCQYKRIDTYFDNDNTGTKITKLMEEIFDGINNFSILFKNYEDYNEFCIKGRFNSDFTPDESSVEIKEIKIKEKERIEISSYSFFNN